MFGVAITLYDMPIEIQIQTALNHLTLTRPKSINTAVTIPAL